MFATRWSRIIFCLCAIVLAHSQLFAPPLAPAQLQKAGDNYNGYLYHNSKLRSFIFHDPRAAGSSAILPLLIVLHGGGMTAEKMLHVTNFNNLSNSFGFYVAYPQAVDNNWNDGRGISQEDDVGFISKLIDYLAVRFPIDSTRILITGASNGGMMTMRIGCELSLKVTGLATVVASMPEPLLTGKAGVPVCAPKRAIKTLMINGTQDKLVPWNGGPVVIGSEVKGRVISVPSSISYWANNSRCSSSPHTINLPDSNTADQTWVARIIYSCPTIKSRVESFTVVNGGHRYYGYVPSPVNEWLTDLIGLDLGNNNFDINTSREIAKFLMDYGYSN